MTNNTSERNQSILNKRDAGHTFGQLARELGITRNRVRQIYEREKQKQRQLAAIQDAGSGTLESLGLPTRVDHALRRAGVVSLDSALEVVREQVDVRNLGPLGLQTLKDALRQKGYLS